MRSVVAIFVLAFITLGTVTLKAQKLYLIPGQGGDHRLFQNIEFPGYETQVIILETPYKKERLPEYARRLISQIDTTQPFSLIGVSFGGMIAVEMTKVLNPEKVIIISSAKTKDELPWKYKVVKSIRLYKLFNGKILKKAANIARPMFEPDSKKDHETFSAMIDDKDPKYLKRAVVCLIRWDNTEYRKDIIHIHGTEDNTIPIKNINNVVRVEGASHVMIMTEGERIGALINRYLHTSDL